MVFNIPSNNNISNATIDTYEIRTQVSMELLLAFFFLFLTVCVLVTTGVRIFTYYAKRRDMFKEKQTDIQE